MTRLDWLQEVYKDYCDKHGLDHVSTCEQSGLTPEQWTWIERFNEQWDKAQEESDVKRMAQNSETFKVELTSEELFEIFLLSSENLKRAFRVWIYKPIRQKILATGGVDT